MTKLQLGELLITRGAKEKLHLPDAVNAIVRHQNGDYGEVSEEDKEANREALETGDRLLSAYIDRNGVRFWIITEADRYCTTVLLPEDY